MKRTTSLLLLALCAPLVVSCVRDELTDTAPSFDSYQAATPNGTVSKVQLDGDRRICWTRADCISVFSGPQNLKYKYTGYTGSLEGSFEKADDIIPGGTYKKTVAVYPYSTASGRTSEDDLLIELPSRQSYLEGSFGLGANTMVAVTNSNDNSLQFSNACGYLMARLYGGYSIQSITLTGNNGEKIAGKAAIKIVSPTQIQVEMQEDAETEIILDCGEQGAVTPKDKDASTEFWFVVPPTKFDKGLTLEITNTFGNKLSLSTDLPIEVKANHAIPVQNTRYAPVIDRINGSNILFGNNLVGLIKDSKTGQGIRNVPVSDGYSFTKTDRNGVYQMKADSKCRYVFYSLPSGYEIPLDASGRPAFYRYTPYIDLSGINRFDFELTPREQEDDHFTIVSISDPQPTSSSGIQRFKNETVSNIVATLDNAQAEGRWGNAIAITLGDITGNAPSLYPSINTVMSDVQLASGAYLPFFQCPGNHDHTNGNSQYEAGAAFVNTFGPMEYSFNIGNAHIVIMDSYIANNWTGTTGGSYTCGFTDAQLEWLEQDFSYVENKEDKVLFFCIHSPFGYGLGDDTNHVYRKNHYKDVLQLFTQFHDAHVLSGHTHQWSNQLLTDYVCRSGRPVFDHNQNASCGWMWQYGQLCLDGSPQGYCIYDVKGNEVVDWLAKATMSPKDFQMRVYDGNQIYIDEEGAECSWYDNSITPLFANPILKDCYVVNCWAADDVYWKLELYVDGVKYGDLSKIPTEMKDLWALAKRKNEKGGHSTPPQSFQHYWYIKAPNNDPSVFTNCEIRATQTVPSSVNKKNVYSCTTLTKDF